MENQKLVLYLIYAPTIGDKGTPYIDSVTKSGDEKCLVFRVAHEYVEIKEEDQFAYEYLGEKEEEKKWLLAVGVDKKTAASCSLMFALETVGGSK